MPSMKENLSRTSNTSVMISLVLVIAGVITLLYPVAAAYIYNASHAREAQKLSSRKKVCLTQIESDGLPKLKAITTD